MRPARILLVLSAALALSLAPGCLPKHLLNPEPSVKRPVVETKATSESLVRYLNEQAQKVNSLKARLDMDAKQGSQALELSGNIACEKPRGFRLRAVAFGQPAVDIGSNNDEFWFWAKERGGNAPLVYCSYSDLATGKVDLPFPFQPDMVMAALGMSSYGTDAKYSMKDNKETNTLDLSMEAKGLDGRQITRTVIFRRTLAQGNKPQVIGHVLKDEKGTIICEATVTAVHEDRTTGAKIPSNVKITWPAAKASITLMLTSIEVNGLQPDQTSVLFTRMAIPGVPSQDLAKWRPSASSMARGR